MSIARKLQQNM